jgi:hypothetical protein
MKRIVKGFFVLQVVGRKLGEKQVQPLWLKVKKTERTPLTDPRTTIDEATQNSQRLGNVLDGDYQRSWKLFQGRKHNLCWEALEDWLLLILTLFPVSL